MTYNYRCYLHNLKTFPVDDKAKMARLASASQATIRKTNCLIHAPKVRKSKGKAPSLPSRKDAMTETRSIEVFLGNKGKKKTGKRVKGATPYCFALLVLYILYSSFVTKNYIPLYEALPCSAQLPYGSIACDPCHQKLDKNDSCWKDVRFRTRWRQHKMLGTSGIAAIFLCSFPTLFFGVTSMFSAYAILWSSYSRMLVPNIPKY